MDKIEFKQYDLTSKERSIKSLLRPEHIESNLPFIVVMEGIFHYLPK